MRRRPFDGGVAPRRQTHPPLEPALRQFEPVDDRGAHLRRIDARPGDDEIVRLDAGVHRVEVDAGQGDEHQHHPLGLEDVHRRLPGDLGARAGGADELLVHALGARQHLEGLGPHPVARKIGVHRPTRCSAPCGRRDMPRSVAQTRPKFIRGSRGYD